MSNVSEEATGGSGAAYRAYVMIRESGVVQIATSSGGISRRGPFGPNYGDDATPFIFMKDGTELLRITGGGGGRTDTPVAGTAGRLVTNDLDVIQELINISGSHGWTAGKGDMLDGTPGPLANHTWGASGRADAFYAGGSVYPSYHGYCKIVYCGPTPPNDTNYGEYQAVQSYIKY